MRPFLNHLLSAILFTPLAGALVILLVSGRRTAAIRGIAGAVAAAGFLLSVVLWFRYEPHGKTWQFAERAEWIPSIGAAFYLGVDGFSILLILLTTLIGGIAVAVAWNGTQKRVKEFYVCLLVLQAGVLGALTALDFLLFFLFWEVTLVPMYLLIGGWGAGQPRHSAFRFLLNTFTGSLALLLGIVALYFYGHRVSGIYSFDVTLFHTLTLPFDAQMWVFLAFFAGFGVTVAMFPFHRWLPGAHSDAPASASVVVAAVFLKLGTYGFLRFSLPILPDAARYFTPLIVTLSIVGIVYGALMALAQTDWKRLIAYASISHMGMVMLAMFALTPAGIIASIVQQVIHAVTIGALFFVVAITSRPAHEVAGQGGLSNGIRVFAAIFLIATLASIGVPVLNRFTGGPPTQGAYGPAPVLRLVETSVGRAVARINPDYASLVEQGSDCATPAAPDPAGPPPVFVLTEPCADAPAQPPKPGTTGR